ncbi:enoyl-CoA hydratase [Rodentibacter pneumotropicus]|uniref:Enoyl-CoA hydratase n=1 Tax=Rodentibacter pneumotropicus TaxID=758 RepID=A0AAW5LB11_9PAST|nr:MULTISPECIES: enoyl-CoA hydratase [Rodentibacter]MCQ9121188.1 enoyl-CoA hydratase [Rodentibacter pneumotropicus]OOF66556.1 enoyl-CoA hydratase [Rodentibacter pneumotropicus]
MNNPVYLALYKNKRSWRKEPLKALADAVTRFFTKGEYSHCELVVERTVFSGNHYEHEVYYDCYSSSVQDGGVRCKQIDVSDREKWDLIPLKNVTEEQIKAYFDRTQGQKYDWWGAIGIALGIKQKRSKYFCSEWCFNAVKNSDKGWRFSPNDLAIIFKK